MKQFDAIVIGTGQAGPFLAVRLAEAGMRVAVVERKRFGGTCVNTGCTPTKTLVASARAAYMARRGGDFGVVINGNIHVDMKKVKARKDAVVRQSNEGIENWLKGTGNMTVFEEHAQFESNDVVRVGGEKLTAKKIFINVGARARVPEAFSAVDYLTNSSMMDIDFLPEHLLIVGGSYIGLEFGQMYRRFGSKVTIIEKGTRLISREDEDISDAVKNILEAEGVAIQLEAECLQARQSGKQITVDLACATGTRQVTGSHLLLAVGRVPNTDDLGLENTGIEVDDRGYIVVDDHLQTTVPGIWALGDCNGRGAFTHTAYNDFEIVASTVLDGESRLLSERIPCYALFIDPPLGRVGMTEAQVRQSGRKALITKREMIRVSRAREKGETQGFMKALVDAESKQFLGAAVLGVGGDEVIHSILEMMYAKAPYTVMQRAVHIHPTITELIPTMLADLRPFQ